jgi:predicted nicotinamide N-methyase
MIPVIECNVHISAERRLPFDKNKMIEDNKDDDLDDISGLFISEEYSMKEFVIGNINQKLLCSNMSSTDHDLTGQIVWPASLQLSWFIYSNQKYFQRKFILELGAGCGLAGFFSLNFGSTALITDGNDVVLRLLRKNKNCLIDYYSHDVVRVGDDGSPLFTEDSIMIEKLQWGIKSKVVDSINKYGIPDILIGADVILWPEQIIHLLRTIRWYLVCAPQSSKVLHHFFLLAICAL